MQEIIWVFGISASGKKTFLEKVEKNSFSEEEMKEIGLPKHCKISKESLMTRNKRDREKMKKEIRSIVSDGFSVVLKYQELDFSGDGQNLVSEVKKEFPDLRHRIIMLFIEYEQKKERWNKRNEESGWGHDPSLEKWSSQHKILLNRIDDFEKQGFDVQYIDSSDGYEVKSHDDVLKMR